MSDEREAKIEAMRNDVAKKLNKWDRPIWGYRGAPEPTRVEGEHWFDENGKEWTVKNGIKQSITKLQDAKTPWWCPNCKKAMSHRFDTKFYRLYNQCYDCTIEQHTKMKLDGTWDAFEKRMLRENEKAYIKDMITERREYIRTFKVPQVHFENGGWEELAKIEHFEGLFQRLRSEIDTLKERLEVIEKEELSEQQQEVTNAGKN